MGLYTLCLLVRMLRIIYMCNGSLLKNWRREKACGFSLKNRSSYPNFTPPIDSLPFESAPLFDLSPSAHITYPSVALVLPPPPTPYSSPSGTSIWRINCDNRGTWTNTRYKDKLFYHSIPDPSLSYQDDIITYHAYIDTYFQTGLLNGTNPCEYAAVTKFIWIIHIGINIYMVINLNTTLQLLRKIWHN